MLRKIAAILTTILVGAFIFTGCGQKEVAVAAKPIDPSLDICASCKMSIVDNHFAAEIINDQGQALKFDDIGCMITYMKKHPDEKASFKGFFVNDYQNQKWLTAETAQFVKGNVHTPMSSGFLAVAQKSDAEKIAGRVDGKVMNWREAQVAHKPKAKMQMPGDGSGQMEGM